MRLPEHCTPDLEARRGKAPYNFVPLPEAIFLPSEQSFEKHDWLDPERLHGYIDLEIVTETELYTRCAYPPSEENKDVQNSPARQQFYHHGEEERPVIPGSSLRGMIRSLVEILSYSRITRRPGSGEVHRVKDERLVYRAVADQKTPTGRAYNDRFLKVIVKNMEFHYPSQQVQAGYLELDPSTNGWCIRPATQRMGTSFIRVTISTLEKNGFPDKKNAVEDVWVKAMPVTHHPHKNGRKLHYARTGEISRSAQPGMVRGNLVYSGPMKSSRHMHTVIYEPDINSKPIPIPNDMREQFCEDRDQQRGIECRKIKSNGDPLFYLLDSNKLVFIGPTLFFRLPYANSTGDFIPPDTVDENGSLDLAELIFGSVNGEKVEGKAHSGAHKGRVRFDDAIMVSTPNGQSAFLEGNDGIRWPSILSSPKPTSYQFYLVQTDREGREKELLSYSAAPPKSKNSGETVLRGFKRYWHRGSAEKDLHLKAPTEHTKQYTVIRPVRPGVTFRARVRFENLTVTELGALLAAIELPESQRHRLGMGKPLGMGSVRIAATISLIDPVARYQSLNAPGVLNPSEQARRIEEARDQFRSKILEHYNKKVAGSRPLGPEARFWDIPRLRDLGLMLEWNRKPRPDKTEYYPDPKEFRSRRVLPTPAGVFGPTKLQAPPPGTTTRPKTTPRLRIGETSQILNSLQTLLADHNLSQRQRLDALTEKLLAELEALSDEQRELAWKTIAESIGNNKKTRDRLNEIEIRLRKSQIP